MGEKVHDIESYVITIRRRHSAAPAPTITASYVSDSVQDAEPAAEAVQVSVPSGVKRAITAPLPGVMIDVHVKAGDRVRAGQVIAILEAMKMENEIQAESDGIIVSVNVRKGDSVLEGTEIVTIQ